ncbi:MAG: LamG domain-containing protein, partial [bacterium]|nr:LamG domain-containing protein [bacterium]
MKKRVIFAFLVIFIVMSVAVSAQSGVFSDDTSSSFSNMVYALDNIFSYITGYAVAGDLDISFVPPTPNEGATVGSGVNVSVNINSGYDSSAFVDWDKSLGGYWGFDDNAVDESTYSNDGTLMKGATYTSGKFSSALMLGSSDDYVNCGSGSSITSDVTDEFTLEAWIKPSGGHSSGSPNRHLFYFVFGQRGPDSYARLHSSGYLQLYLQTTSGTFYTDVSGDRTSWDDRWYHIAFVYDKDAGVIKKYVDGAQDGSSLPVSGDVLSGSYPFLIGSPWGGSFNGGIDDVKVWKRALSDLEIKASYNSRVNPLFASFNGLSEGFYYYYSYGVDTSGNSGKTETRVVAVGFSEECSDGTTYGACSDTQPWYCNNGVLIDDCDRCGCPSDKECDDDGSCVVPPEPDTCSDGTLYGECSDTQPWYCNNGVLVNLCSTCECPSGKSCDPDGSCVVDPDTCSDGTVYGECSDNKPKYCTSSGSLVDLCSTCECPSGETCQSDGSCDTVITDDLSVNFIHPTPNNGAVVGDGVTINVGVTGEHDSSAFIDWDRSLIGYWNFDGVSDKSTYGKSCSVSGATQVSNGRFGSA